jgi:hypothetical protein
MATPSLFKAEAVHSAPHLHVVGDVCPLCDQAIPDERLDEINGRMEAWQQAQANEVAARLQEQFAREKADAIAKVQADAVAALEQQREETAGKVAAARDEARQLAEMQAQEKLDAAERMREAEKKALAEKLQTAEAAQAAATSNVTSLTAQLNQVRVEGEAALARPIHEHGFADDADRWCAGSRGVSFTAGEAGLVERAGG